MDTITMEHSIIFDDDYRRFMIDEMATAFGVPASELGQGRPTIEFYDAAPPHMERKYCLALRLRRQYTRLRQLVKKRGYMSPTRRYTIIEGPLVIRHDFDYKPTDEGRRF